MSDRYNELEKKRKEKLMRKYLVCRDELQSPTLPTSTWQSDKGFKLPQASAISLPGVGH